MDIEITHASDPSLDAWKGMADFTKLGGLGRVSVTREEYEEWGGERIKRWWAGNRNGSVAL
jgi:actin-related protein 5